MLHIGPFTSKTKVKTTATNRECVSFGKPSSLHTKKHTDQNTKINFVNVNIEIKRNNISISAAWIYSCIFIYKYLAYCCLNYLFWHYE